VQQVAGDVFAGEPVQKGRLCQDTSTYGLGDSGRTGTPDDGCADLGLGDSGTTGTPEEGVVIFGRGDSGRTGTPLANEIA